MRRTSIVEDNFLRMTFKAKEAVILEGGQIDKSEGGAMGGAIDTKQGGQIGGQIDKIADVTYRQKEILKLIDANNQISRAGIAEIIHVNESAIQKHLNTLKDKGILDRVGGTRGHCQINIEPNG